MSKSVRLYAVLFVLAILGACEQGGNANAAKRSTVTDIEWYSSGEKRREVVTILDSSGNIVSVEERRWHENGSLAEHAEYDGNGWIDKKYTWYSTGSIESALLWDPAPPGSGVMRAWYQNGQQRDYSEVSRTLSGDPIPNGASASWFEDGRLREGGAHRYGDKEGIWYVVDEQGVAHKKDYERQRE